MALTPLDIHNKDFNRVLRGYNPREVDEFLDQVVREFEKMVKDNAALREQIETLTSKVEQYRNLEDTLHNTLVVAQATSDEVKESAHQEAQLIVAEARLKSEEHVRQAQRRAERILREYQGLRRQMDKFRAQFKGLLHSHMELLEEQKREMDHGHSMPEHGLDDLSHRDEDAGPPREDPGDAGGGNGAQVTAEAEADAQRRVASARDDAGEARAEDGQQAAGEAEQSKPD